MLKFLKFLVVIIIYIICKVYRFYFDVLLYKSVKYLNVLLLKFIVYF